MASVSSGAGVSMFTRLSVLIMTLILCSVSALCAEEPPYLYGIHDTDPCPEEYLNHIRAVVPRAWVTATMAVGHDPNDQSGYDFSWYANNGYTIICRLNNGYYPNGTIPRPADYADFAQRCANYVRNSRGCEIWLIGNETNIAGEWPAEGSSMPFVSPQDYADCYRQCYNAIKAVAPTHKVITQGLAPFSGPFNAGYVGDYYHEGNPYSWVDYMNAMLTAIKASGGIDGIGMHVYSRGYAYTDIHNTYRRWISGKNLYWSFYCYKDWVDYGIPSNMYNLPIYITECNGYYYWRGGHPESPLSHYQPGFVSEVYREIDNYNKNVALPQSKPVIRCVNMYRWAPHLDYWNIDGDNPYKAQILSDLDDAIAAEYVWPGAKTIPSAWRDDFDDNHLDEDFPEEDWSSFSEANGRYDELDGWLKLSGQAGQASREVVYNKYYRIYHNFTAATRLTLTDATPTTGTSSEAIVRFRADKDGNGYALCFRCGDSPENISLRRTDTWEVVQGMKVDRPLPSGSTFFVRIECEGTRLGIKIGSTEGGTDIANWSCTDGTFTGKGCFWLEMQRMMDLRFDYFSYEPMGGVKGTVWDSLGNTLAGATVAASTGGYSTVSGSDGTYALRGMDPGSYTVTASKANYKSHAQSNISIAEIMTNADFALTDATRPETPVVTDGGEYQTSSDSMTFSWTCADPESGIAEYRCAIAKSTSLIDLIPGGEWQSVGTATSHTRTGLSLENGQTYYAFVRSKNGVNLTSLNGASDGIRIAKGAAGVGQAKGEADGVLVALEDKVVTASLPDCSYIQDLYRAGGMRIDTTGVAEGSVVDLAGYLTTIDGERCLDVYSIGVNGTTLLSPLGLRGKAFGGDALNSYTPSLVLYNGPHNSGLLVKSWGRVKAVGAGWFTISDGSVAVLKVLMPAGVTAPDVDSFVSVIGISAIESGAGGLAPVLRVRRQGDIRDLD